MKMCETCEKRDICTTRTHCNAYKELRKRLERLQISIERWEQFEREWQQVTDKLKKYFGGGQ